ncbi:DEAD/DEAH box helicase [Bacillus fonticola]|uniref:DEAD/DEAH box helicase n=1 Tax=Bacillus fonticola TaxID=2728853 RepID=UPI001473F2F2|nr:DEAD/DEAH box helicase [Bacillus fonticola]
MWKHQTIQDVLQKLQESPEHAAQFVYHKVLPAREAKSVPFPGEMHAALKAAFKTRGISSLYTHQARAFELARQRQSFVAITPTASGKTLCYNAPVVQSILENDQARALYLFPTKALANDQKAELQELGDSLPISLRGFTYDGDTPASIRQKVRKAGHIVMTNPDMLHSAILPHHTKWVSFFEQLKVVVIDELHTYRGVFGSHVANVIRRLKRICRHYGSNPIFICTSATIANPKQLAEQITGEVVEVVDNNGAPAGKKHFYFYNPPVVHSGLMVRESALVSARKLAEACLREHIQTIVFARSRVRVEILVKYLQTLVTRELGPKSIRGYRGGYLPSERREIEQGLRDGSIYGVISTNALELGVDIGQLQVCILTGYPGSIASSWQQAGRAGRRNEESVVIFVASSSPLDQYIMQNPDFFFKQTPEEAQIDPDNLIIFMDHLKCAAYELAFSLDEKFGAYDLEECLDYLEEERVLYRNGDKMYWMTDAFPAHNVSLRSASQENVVIIDQTNTPHHQIIGEMDRFSALTLLHEEAIYLHQGIQYQVETLDWEEKKAYVREVNVDYFTDANLAVSLDVLEVDKSQPFSSAEIHYGDVSVRAMATIFKKIQFNTHDNVGSGPIHLPEEELHTTSCWISFDEPSDSKSMEEGLLGASHALRHLVSIYAMCDVGDVHVIPQIKATHNGKPTIFFYDRYPGGVGLSKQVFSKWQEIVKEAVGAISQCPCTSGCPSCVGMDPRTERAKAETIKLLKQLISLSKVEAHG